MTRTITALLLLLASSAAALAAGKGLEIGYVESFDRSADAYSIVSGGTAKKVAILAPIENGDVIAVKDPSASITLRLVGRDDPVVISQANQNQPITAEVPQKSFWSGLFSWTSASVDVFDQEQREQVSASIRGDGGKNLIAPLFATPQTLVAGKRALAIGWATPRTVDIQILNKGGKRVAEGRASGGLWTTPEIDWKPGIYRIEIASGGETVRQTLTFIAPKKAPAPRSGARGGTSIRASKDGVEMVFGRNSVLEALRSAVPGKALYVQQFLESDDRVREAFELAAELHLPMLEAQRSHLDKMTNGSVHQGLVLEVPPYEYAEAADLLDLAAAAGEAPLIVALDGITDPRNLGAVVRSAAAFGAHGVLVPERRAAGMTASAWKTSAGAAARVPVARATNLTRALKAYAEAGCFIIGLAAGETSLDDLDPDISTGPIVIVLGSEGEGLSRLVSEACDIVVGIPMTSTTESLNAGVAAGVTLYAVSHARRAR